jgi:hypothetical protein
VILTPAELELLTGKTARAQKRYGSQARELELLGVPYLLRSDRTLIVYRNHTDARRPAQNEETSAPAVLL